MLLYLSYIHHKKKLVNDKMFTTQYLQKINMITADNILSILLCIT